MKILVDRHHAGLLYSLQLLFEDRFGMELYVPVGHDWWDEMYWRFGDVFGDDRLAQQYLNPNPPWQEDPLCEHGVGSYFTQDVEFPDRLVRGCSLAQFRAHQFDFVMATVQENQPGFYRLAQEAGAKYLLQVGNRGQQVDWNLDPLALVSAEAPIRGRGVQYHQEYAKDTTFRFGDPDMHASPRVVRSFVNCFDRIPTEYALFQRFRAAAPSLMYFEHGHDGKDGLVQPTSVIAEVMRASGWGYHDKPQGDGFGHVIHYWASVGRPLIGHASYYDGLMPGPLWEDGVTAVTLDNRSPEEAAALVEEISGDRARYEAMCFAIRERVDGLVDFEAEAAAIAQLLGL
jgi:hypothetical protein